MLPRLPGAGPNLANSGSALDVTAGEVTLLLAADTSVEISLDDRILGQVGSQLRPVKIDDPTTMPFVDVAELPKSVYGFAPFEMRFSRKTPVSFANATGLPAGAAVEIRSLTGLAGDGPPAGRLRRVAFAHVSVDGLRIEMAPGEGISDLTWLALFHR